MKNFSNKIDIGAVNNLNLDEIFRLKRIVFDILDLSAMVFFSKKFIIFRPQFTNNPKQFMEIFRKQKSFLLILKHIEREIREQI